MSEKFKKEWEDITFFAFRYALPRRSASSSIVSDYVVKHWGEFQDWTQQQFKREINLWMRMDDKAEGYQLEYWNKILKLKSKKDGCD